MESKHIAPIILVGALGYLLGKYGGSMVNFFYPKRSQAKFLEPPRFTSEVMQYAREIGLREHPALKELRLETAKHEKARMMSAPDEANFFTLLLKTIQANKVIEIGVFTGYGTLALALGLPKNGKVLALDVNAEWPAIGKPFWEKAGVSDKIQLKIAPASESLAQLVKDESGTFDFAFVDADKANYVNYLEALLPLLRPGGLIAFDNVLWHGKVVDTKSTDPDTVGIRALNVKLQNDPRVEIAMLTIADGVTFVRKL